jgi:hypothetical protein
VHPTPLDRIIQSGEISTRFPIRDVTARLRGVRCTDATKERAASLMTFPPTYWPDFEKAIQQLKPTELQKLVLASLRESARREARGVA